MRLGAILEIIVACMAALWGIYIFVFAVYLGPLYYNEMSVGIWGIAAFGFGLSGGIKALERSLFVLGLLGAIFCLVFGVVAIVMFPNAMNFAKFAFTIMAILSTLSLVFIAVSYREF